MNDKDRDVKDAATTINKELSWLPSNAISHINFMNYVWLVIKYSEFKNGYNW